MYTTQLIFIVLVTVVGLWELWYALSTENQQLLSELKKITKDYEGNNRDAHHTKGLTPRSLFLYPFHGLFAVEYSSDVEPLIIKTDPPFLLMVDTKNDVYIAEDIISEGIWENEKTAIVKDISNWIFANRPNNSPPPVFLDVGANMGYFGFIMYLNGFSSIIIEPIPNQLALIRKSVEINRFFGHKNEITIFPFAASNATGKADLKLVAINRGGSTLLEEKVKLENATVEFTIGVRTEKLDDWITERIDFLKIDTEGFETCVVKGAQNLISKSMPKFISIEVWVDLSPCGTPEDMLRWFRDKGYLLCPLTKIPTKTEDCQFDLKNMRKLILGPLAPFFEILLVHSSVVHWVCSRVTCTKS